MRRWRSRRRAKTQERELGKYTVCPPEDTPLGSTWSLTLHTPESGKPASVSSTRSLTLFWQVSTVSTAPHIFFQLPCSFLAYPGFIKLCEQRDTVQSHLYGFLHRTPFERRLVFLRVSESRPSESLQGAVRSFYNLRSEIKIQEAG